MMIWLCEEHAHLAGAISYDEIRRRWKYWTCGCYILDDEN